MPLSAFCLSSAETPSLPKIEPKTEDYCADDSVLFVLLAFSPDKNPPICFFSGVLGLYSYSVFPSSCTVAFLKSIPSPPNL